MTKINIVNLHINPMTVAYTKLKKGDIIVNEQHNSVSIIIDTDKCGNHKLLDLSEDGLSYIMYVNEANWYLVENIDITIGKRTKVINGL